MAYLLIMHGKWISRSGKLFFSYPDDLDKYIREITFEALRNLRGYLGRKKALSKIELSYSIIEVSDTSPLKSLFHENPVVHQEIFKQKFRYEPTKPIKKTICVVERSNEDGIGHPQVQNERGDTDS